MVFRPLIDMRSTTIRNAFFLNAIVLAAIATASIELRRFIDIRKETKRLSETKKFIITMIGTFLIGMLIYIIFRIVFGFGEGLLANPPFTKTLF